MQASSHMSVKETISERKSFPCRDCGRSVEEVEPGRWTKNLRPGDRLWTEEGVCEECDYRITKVRKPRRESSNALTN